jgi:hypothetical protein
MLDAIKQRLAERADTHVGLLAEFSDPGALYDAVKALRKQGYSRLDTFSPFPIHGMDGAMGLSVSPLGFLAFVGGVTGLALSIFLQWWTSAGPQLNWVDVILQGYPINISNKPLFAWESSVPIMFELTILFTALTIVGGMLALNGLPQPYNPLFHSERFGRATDDGFFLHVGRGDKAYGDASTAGALYELGALGVEFVDHDGATAVGADGAPEATDDDDDLSAPAAPAHTTGSI